MVSGYRVEKSWQLGMATFVEVDDNAVGLVVGVGREIDGRHAEL